MGVREADAAAGIDVGTLARRGIVAVVGSLVVNLAVTFAALSAGIGTDLRSVSVTSVGFLTVAGVSGSVVVYGLLSRFVADADLWFTVVAAVVLVVSVIPDFTYIPTEPGGSLAAGLVLASMHAATAVICVAVLTGRVPVDL